MADTSALQFVQVPSRSISLPARLHPSSLVVEAELNKLKTSWESSSSSSVVSSTTPFGVESIQTGLIKLAELYNCIEDQLIHYPLTQQTLHNQHHLGLVEEALDRSIGLLDACGNARELILSMKEQVQELQSALRRRGGDSSTETNIHAYISFRKKSKKNIAKCLRALKRTESNIDSFPIVDTDQHISLVTKVLRESSGLTISIFRSLLLFLYMPEMKTKASGWSLIRKLIPAASDQRGKKIFNEVGSVDMALNTLHEHVRKDNGKVDVQKTLQRLETLDFSIKGLESGLDCLFRRLIQNRVSLLNVLTP